MIRVLLQKRLVDLGGARIIKSHLAPRAKIIKGAGRILRGELKTERLLKQLLKDWKHCNPEMH